LGWKKTFLKIKGEETRGNKRKIEKTGVYEKQIKIFPKKC